MRKATTAPRWWEEPSCSDFIAAATVHEAAGRTGALPAAIKPVDPGFRLWGPALTVSCASGDNLWLHRALYRAEPGFVLVVDVGQSDVEYGYWGEILSEAAVSRGLGGLVLNGGVRDSDRLAELGFPVFSTGLSIRGTIKNAASPGQAGETIRLADVEVHSGDLVCGDSDGVVVIGRDQVGQVVAAAVAREEKERTLIQQLRAGERTLELLGLE